MAHVVLKSKGVPRMYAKIIILWLKGILRLWIRFVTLAFEDGVSWLLGVHTQHVFHFEEVQKWYKQNVDKYHKK